MDPKDPKRPLNAFILFARQRRPRIGGKVADSSKLLAKEWKKMRTSEKKKYCSQAQALKDEFRERFPDFKKCIAESLRLRAVEPTADLNATSSVPTSHLTPGLPESI
ncbi:high mobility group box domain-containing protein [Mycena leptocephala]|nr:high mobility group box domain-containing protein [Mycena leptocephala]